MSQLGIFDTRAKVDAAARRAREESYEERFAAFHAANPEVYATLLRLARRVVAAGHKRIGIRMIWERMRWELTVEVEHAPDDFRLNDHMTSRYARLLSQEPDLAGVFELRELRSA
jgi:hypothetical protein